MQNFPPNIQEQLKKGESDQSKPVLEDWEAYDKLCVCKKPNSIVPGDLPIKLTLFNTAS
jgi:hypothetical protein